MANFLGLSLALFLPLWSFGILTSPQSTAMAADARKIEAKDLAIALPLSMPDLPSVSTRLASGETLFPPAWYAAVLRAYANTVVGDALQRENRFQDWKLVTLRVVPCEPIGAVPNREIDRLCWPELRLVFQPVLKNFVRFGRTLEVYADDRAIHVGYPVPPELGLSSSDANQARTLLSKAENARERPIPIIQPLRSEELETLARLRQIVARQFLSDTLRLRSANAAGEDFKTIGLRPEAFEGKADQVAFAARLVGYLSLYARPGEMRNFTSFSLTEGRDPPQLDEWVFLAFKGSKDRLESKPITLHSLADGRQLGAGLESQRGTMSADDDYFYEQSTNDATWLEIQKLVMLDPSRPANFLAAMADREQRLVRNTSCVSCHKLSSQKFDFHSFSYFEDQDVTVSPRVERDVQLDLNWIRKNL